ncbi:hypothetical protein [Acinetobacter haemolyticus]|uniref:hypothetical protein n=1 Tax=Acinetobacter haemolyticus TaxID=29430 RepID=UPI000D687418|nr:hypothetical protein [Acinetobacter haemolyticus]
MLPTKILKLRLARIAKGKAHLSTQDKLMLVTMESPDLSAHFILRLFKMSLPKQWKFKHETAEDIFYAMQLIELIETELIDAYEMHARKYAWYEQCLMYLLNFVVLQPTQQQINGYLRQLDQCLDQAPKIDLLKYFQQHYPSTQHAVALAKAHAGAEQYTQAIEQYEWAMQHATQSNEVAFFAYVNCLIQRQQEYRNDVGDVAYAIDLLCRYKKPIDQKAYRKTIQHAVTAFLPPATLQSRAVETHVLADVGRSLNAIGKSMGGIFGSKNVDIPYSQQVIESAPQLLMDSHIIESLKQSEIMQAAMLRVTGTSSIEQNVLAHGLGNLWLLLSQKNEVLSLFAQATPYNRLDQLLNVLQPETTSSLELGDIQTILDQGLMTYLGDTRLDKHHPERSALYAQRDQLVAEMIGVATWFQQTILRPFADQQVQQLQEMQSHLYEQLDDITLSSGLFAYQYEKQQRAQDLWSWLQRKLDKGTEFEKIQAAWVSLRELRHFNLDGVQEKIRQLQQHLEHYKRIRLEQIVIVQPSVAISPVQENGDP